MVDSSYIQVENMKLAVNACRSWIEFWRWRFENWPIDNHMCIYDSRIELIKMICLCNFCWLISYIVQDFSFRIPYFSQFISYRCQVIICSMKISPFVYSRSGVLYRLKPLQRHLKAIFQIGFWNDTRNDMMLLIYIQVVQES